MSAADGNDHARARLVLLAGPSDLRHDPAYSGAAASVVDVDLSVEGAAPNTIILPWEKVGVRCGPMAPLFLLAATRRGWQPYTQLSFTGTDLLFVALPGERLEGDPAVPADVAVWKAVLADRHRACGARAVNHQRWWANVLPGQELEHKFTLPGVADVWSMTASLHGAIRGGALRGWVLEHGAGGGFEQWDFDNHLFEITGPEAERGYIAFIPAVNGSWIIRRKRFASDAALRHEDLIDGVDLGADPDLPAVIADRFGLTPAWGSVYRRIRGNVLLESLPTGHVFSIMVDRCVDRTGRTDDLYQVEVEYVRSRILRPGDPATLVADYELLVGWTRSWLTEHGIIPAEDHLSKLSWLRPVAGGPR